MLEGDSVHICGDDENHADIDGDNAALLTNLNEEYSEYPIG